MKAYSILATIGNGVFGVRFQIRSDAKRHSIACPKSDRRIWNPTLIFSALG